MATTLPGFRLRIVFVAPFPRLHGPQGIRRLSAVIYGVAVFLDCGVGIMESRVSTGVHPPIVHRLSSMRASFPVNQNGLMDQFTAPPS